MYWKGIARTGDERKKQWPLRLNPGSAQEIPTGGLNWRFHGSLSVERGGGKCPLTYDEQNVKGPTHNNNSNRAYSTRLAQK